MTGEVLGMFINNGTTSYIKVVYTLQQSKDGRNWVDCKAQETITYYPPSNCQVPTQYPNLSTSCGLRAGEYGTLGQKCTVYSPAEIAGAYECTSSGWK